MTSTPPPVPARPPWKAALGVLAALAAVVLVWQVVLPALQCLT